MKTAKEWYDSISTPVVDADLVRLFEAIQRDALEAAVKACPPKSGRKSQFDANYELACQHYKEDILKILHTLPPSKVA